MTERFRRPGEFVREELEDQIDRTRHLLAGSPEEAAARVLERVAGEGEVEARIVNDLTHLAPLAQPDRFREAHRVAMRALEVFDRDGSRDPQVPNLGPLSPLAERGVSFVAEFIVKSYAKDVADKLRKLYARREAQCPPDIPERRLLARARVEADRLAPGYSGGGGLPVLLAGGAAVPVLGAAARELGALRLGDARVLILGVMVLAALFGALSWVLLRGAGVAHRRSRLIMQPALAALWAAIGHCGDPPEDDSILYATIAITLTAIVWFVAPAVVTVAFFV